MSTALAGLPDDDYALLAASGLFDADFYRTQARLPPGVDAVQHYLLAGWIGGLQPRPDFESEFVQPFYEAAGLQGPPLLRWLELSAQIDWLPYNRGAAEERAARIRPSPVFDAESYASRLPPGMDPALHYVLVGEALGWRPSPGFDPVFYLERHPDVAESGFSPLLHFEVAGRQERRTARPAADSLAFPALPASGLPTVLLFVHEASRTGAPILGWSIAGHLRDRYDVVSVVLKGGEMETDFADVSAAIVGPMMWEEWHPAEMSRVAERLVQTYRPLFAICNSIETNLLVPPLAMRGVPSVALIHEFAAYTRPLEKLSNVFDWASEIVFPAQIVAQSAFRTFPHMRARRGLHIMAQGRVDPPKTHTENDKNGPLALPVLRTADAPNAFIVLGAGQVQIRKGVDVFFSVAAGVHRLAPELDVRFFWIGDGYDPLKDPLYSAYLAEQYEASDLDKLVTMLSPVPDLDPLYAASNLFLLSSRLDPQPNVGIDAVLRGLPVVCFEGASGTAEVLGADPETKALVAPYLDAGAAAEIICRLARDRAEYDALSAAVQRVGRRAYDMETYIAQVEALGQRAAAKLQERDRQTLLRASVLDPDLILPPGALAPGFDGLANVVLQQWAVVGTSLNQTANVFFRRPCAGFHPQAYAVAHPQACAENGENPTAHWLRAGRPAGAWSREVIAPLREPTRAPIRLALHAHFYYAGLAGDLASRIAACKTSCDIFLTTDTAAKADQLREAFVGHRDRVTVAVVPNRGRDIGPFLYSLPDLADYDAIGHLHGKRSTATDAGMGDRWREFLWENLVGSQYPMLDTAAAIFAERPQVGLLMAEDPHLVGWDKNQALAAELAQRMGLPVIEQNFFDFPLGTMFWARPRALHPLLDLGLSWDDYPEEPVPYDGTVLHALERLIPFVVQSTGASLLGLRAPGTTW